MPRTAAARQLASLPSNALRPVGSTGQTALTSALERLTLWSDSLTSRLQAMEKINFPLDGDLPAFLLFVQVTYAGAMRPTDIANALRTGSSNVTKIVHRLEAAGLVARVESPDDDRSVVVCLTDDGRHMGGRLVAAGEELFEAVLSTWTDKDVATLAGLLDRLATDLATTSDPLAVAITAS